MNRWFMSIGSILALPIIGVNTFTNPATSLSADEADSFDMEVTRSDEGEKKMVIERNEAFKEENKQKAEEGLARLKQVARDGGNLFEVMMDIVEYCSVGQVTQALFEILVESSVGICDNMAIEILPELLEEFFKHFKVYLDLYNSYRISCFTQFHLES